MRIFLFYSTTICSSHNLNVIFFVSTNHADWSAQRVDSGFVWLCRKYPPVEWRNWLMIFPPHNRSRFNWSTHRRLWSTCGTREQRLIHCFYDIPGGSAVQSNPNQWSSIRTPVAAIVWSLCSLGSNATIRQADEWEEWCLNICNAIGASAAERSTIRKGDMILSRIMLVIGDLPLDLSLWYSTINALLLCSRIIIKYKRAGDEGRIRRGHFNSL